MNRKTLVLLIGVIIIASFFRLYHLTTVPPGLYPDEAMNGSNALEALHTAPPVGGFKVFYPENNGREGLFMNIQAMFLAATGIREPWMLRLPSALFGILTVLGVFFFTRELFGRKGNGEWGMGNGIPKADTIALFASFFLATSFWHINFSRIGFRAITASFFLVWALYFFLRAGRSKSYILNSIFSGIFFGLGFYSYISYRVAPLLFLLFIPFFRKEKNFWKATGIFLIVTFVVALPIGWYYLKHPADFLGRTTQVSVASASNPLQDLALNTLKTVGMLNFKGDGNWRHNFADRPELFWPVGILFWIGAAMGIRAIFRKGGEDRFEFLLLFGWLALATLPVVLSDEGIPHALRSILMVVPIMVLAAAGAEWLFGKLSNTTARTTLVSVLCLVLMAEAYHTYFIAWAQNPNVPGAFAADYVETGREIRALPDTTPKYVVIRAGGGTTPIRDPFDSAGRIQEIPIPAQTVMFLTDSFSPERQKEHNIHYVLPPDEGKIPPGALRFYIN